MKEPKHMVDQAKAAGDGISIVATVGSLAGWLPTIAALASIIWTCIRIYETKTVQGWIKKLKGGSKKRDAGVVTPSRERADD